MKEATLQRKIKAVSEVADKIKNSQGQIIVNVIGLTVEQVTELRSLLHAQDCQLRVIKNNIILRAAKEAEIADLDSFLTGPTAVAFSNDAARAAKTIHDFARKNTKLKLKAGIVDGLVMDADEIKIFASLPNKEGMLSMLLSVLQAPIRNLAYAVKGIAEQNA